MQQGGTLKKRKRRNLAKVNGLATIQYDEGDDNYDGVTVFSKNTQDDNRSGRSETDTRIRMSDVFKDNSFHQSSRSSSNSRVTRDPTFHVEEDKNNSEDEYNWDIPPTTSDSHEGLGNTKDRPYFLDKSTISRFRQIVLLGMLSGSFPWIWNAKKHRVDRWSPFWEKLWNFVFSLVMVQTCFLTLFQFYPMYNGVSQHEEQTSYRELFMGSLNVFVYGSAVAFNVNMFYYKEQMRTYINTLFLFNRKYMEKYVVDLDGYKDGGRVVVNLSIPSNMCQVAASMARFLVMPFAPWYLFSYIHPKPWYWLLPGVMQEFFVIGQTITNYILYQWMVVAHANSMEFWLRESHRSNESGYTISEFRRPKTAVETYRALQIMGNRFNDCMAPMSIPLMKLHIFVCIIPCGFVFLRSMNHHFVEEFPAILSFPIGFINTSTTGFCTMSVAASVFDLAGGFIDSWNKTRHKGFRRILMSCPMLKLKMARFYFITVSTTITFFKVVVDNITNCIITFP